MQVLSLIIKAGQCTFLRQAIRAWFLMTRQNLAPCARAATYATDQVVPAKKEVAGETDKGFQNIRDALTKKVKKAYKTSLHALCETHMTLASNNEGRAVDK